MNGFIYCITNKVNGKQYVGKTMDTVEQRFKEHLRNVNTERNKKRPLYAAFKKYGINSFIVSTLEECEESLLNEREIFWINKLDTYRNGYNATCGGDGFTKYNYEAIWEKYQELQNIQATARLFGCDRRVVRSIINKHGIFNNTGGVPVPIYQLEKDSLQIIQKFDSINQAAKACNGVSAPIRQVLKDISKTAYGFRWCKIDDYDKIQLPKQRIVQQLDVETGEVIQEFKNFRQASLTICGSPNGGTNIKKVCMGKRQTAYGYRWREIK